MSEHVKYKDVELIIGDESDVDLSQTFNTIMVWLKGIDRLEILKIADGCHTFEQLYRQQIYLAAALFNSHPDICWKSRYHEDGLKPFGGGWFIVGIDTPAGQYTYHYENKYWNLFDVPVLKKSPKWDGHTGENVDRLMSIFGKEFEIDGESDEIQSL